MLDNIKNHYNNIAQSRDSFRKRNSYFHRELEKFYEFTVLPGKTVIELGCATGELLNRLNPSLGVGIDISFGMLKIAKQKFPHLNFVVANSGRLCVKSQFDYVVASGLIGELDDIQAFIDGLHLLCHVDTRIILDFYNHLWEPFLTLAERIKLKMPQLLQNWFVADDIKNLLELSDFQIIKKAERTLFPFNIPLVSFFVNRILAKLPIISKLSICGIMVARSMKKAGVSTQTSVSVIVPARNEAGNIEELVSRLPTLGESMEIIFVEGHSTDNTTDVIKNVIKCNPQLDMKFIYQDGVGKYDAVKKGFSQARGNVLIILDADISVAPEDLKKFYALMRSGKGEFINGTRLVYPMEKQAMRFLNMIGNTAFSWIFTWLLEQRFTDTLCGTKVMFKKHYDIIKEHSADWWGFDPFGDFSLIFGADKLNLKIVEIPIRYKERKYGSTNIRRFKHAWLLFKMCWNAFLKFKLK